MMTASTVRVHFQAIAFCVLAFSVAPLEAAKPSGGDGGASKPGQTRVGIASFYGKGLQGKKTADGEQFDKNDITAAHPTYPLGTRLKVTNLDNGKSINVRVNDRGPVKKYQRKGVIIDLSERAAKELEFKRDGKTRVRTTVLEWGEGPAKAASDVPVKNVTFESAK
jgi:rare lipoprotein A